MFSQKTEGDTVWDCADRVNLLHLPTQAASEAKPDLQDVQSGLTALYLQWCHCPAGGAGVSAPLTLIFSPGLHLFSQDHVGGQVWAANDLGWAPGLRAQHRPA